MKRIILIVILVAIIAVVLVKQKLKEIVISLKQFDVTELTKESAKGFFILKVINPFPNVEASDLDVILYLNEKVVARIKKKNPVIKTDKEATYIQGDFNLDIKTVLSGDVMVLLEQPEKKYRIIGTITIKKFGINFKAPIDYTNTFKL